MDGLQQKIPWKLAWFRGTPNPPFMETPISTEKENTNSVAQRKTLLPEVWWLGTSPPTCLRNPAWPILDGWNPKKTMGCLPPSTGDSDFSTIHTITITYESLDAFGEFQLAGRTSGVSYEVGHRRTEWSASRKNLRVIIPLLSFQTSEIHKTNRSYQNWWQQSLTTRDHPWPVPTPISCDVIAQQLWLSSTKAQTNRSKELFAGKT